MALTMSEAGKVPQHIAAWKDLADQAAAQAAADASLGLDVSGTGDLVNAIRTHGATMESNYGPAVEALRGVGGELADKFQDA